MGISMDIHGKSVNMNLDMDGKLHIHGKPSYIPYPNPIPNPNPKHSRKNVINN